MKLNLKSRFPYLAVPALTRRIMIINLIGLAVLMITVLSLNRAQDAVLETQSELLSRQAATLAVVIAGVSAEETSDTPVSTPEQLASEAGSLQIVSNNSEALMNYLMRRANHILRNIAVPSGVRIQLYDNAGRLTGDTRSLLSDTRLEERLLATPETSRSFLKILEQAYLSIAKHFNSPLPEYEEAIKGYIARPEQTWVWQSLAGEQPEVSYHRNSADELIMTASAPIRRVQGVMGALVISTEGDAVDLLIAKGRAEIFRILLYGAPVFALLSLWMARTIAQPIRRLAKAAETGTGVTLNPTRIIIPDLTDRNDEIGDLSVSLRHMTNALYERIDATGNFAADVAHEIKNPLTSLRSAVETMRIARNDETRERLLEVIEHDVSRMDRLVTDISNASRIDAEMVREGQDPIDLNALIQGVVGIAQPVAEESGVIVLAQPMEQAAYVLGTESRLAQVLHNFIDNAISFSPVGGEIIVTVQPHRTMLRVTVRDQGIGIPPANLESVFKRFYTERPGVENFGNNSGLGLSISQQIIEAHGGKIWAENIQDSAGNIQGAQFAFSLTPLRQGKSKTIIK